MKITDDKQRLSPERVQRFQLNNSVSKAQYSFPKTKRFSEEKIICKKHAYDLPEIKHTRSTSFGLGHKMNLQNLNQKDIPPPGTYNPEPEDIKDAKRSGFTFGISREVAKCYSFLNKDVTIPGPAAYQLNKSTLARSFSIGRTLVDRDLAHKGQSPGPAKYHNEGKSNGKFVLAKHKNLPTIKIAKHIERCKTEHTPGPLDYDPVFLNSKCQKSINSKNPVNAWRFPETKRTACESLLEVSQYPGPGNYYRFSEFLQ